MSISQSKLKEVVASSAVGTWVSVADYRQVSVLSDGTAATLTLRQATDASGTGAKDLGTAGTDQVTELVEQMDVANGFTYVSATVSVVSPAETAVLVRSHGRFSE